MDTMVLTELKKYYCHIPQGHGRVILLNGLPEGTVGVGTDFCGPCLGFYFKLDETRSNPDSILAKQQN